MLNVPIKCVTHLKDSEYRIKTSNFNPCLVHIAVKDWPVCIWSENSYNLYQVHEFNLFQKCIYFKDANCIVKTDYWTLHVCLFVYLNNQNNVVQIWILFQLILSHTSSLCNNVFPYKIPIRKNITSRYFNFDILFQKRFWHMIISSDLQWTSSLCPGFFPIARDTYW